MELLKPGSSLHGFTVVSRTDLSEYDGAGIRLNHTATGLDLFHIHTPDPENFFAFIFKTPPKNNNGTAHILEHSVLAGSRRFPVKDPFLELMKGSAQTFLNAFTFPDKTIYPAASPLKKDFFHLFDVYGDAVFFPLLRKEVFHQEGVRIISSPKGKISFDGIVFNEMRGAYSDHDSITAVKSYRSLFPDTPYGMDSGGTPTEIINLSYEEFHGFHAEYYHPSNCRVFLYGDIPTEEHLQFLEEKFLHQFTAIKTDSAISVPRTWRKPESYTFNSPGMEGDNEDTRGSAIINWIAGTATNPVEVMTLEVLTETLLGNPGAPLYRAIIESGLGRDIASMSGMEADFREIVFSIGIKGILSEYVPDFEKLILQCLEKLVKKGIPKKYISSAVKRIEFHHREMRGGVPQGLRAMSRSLRGWLHGADPETTLVFNSVMEIVKKHLGEDKSYLETFVTKHLLQNSHRSLVTVIPNKNYIDKQNALIRKSARETESKANKKDLRRIQDDQQKLKIYHDQADTEEALESIPGLSIDDMPEKVSTIETQAASLKELPGYRHTFFTNGIVYIDFSFDISGLSVEEEKLLPLFSRLIYMTGIPGHSYNEVSQLLAEKTGGFYVFLDTGSPVESDSASRFLFFRCKVLEKEVKTALDLIFNILGKSELSDIKRIKDIIQEQSSDFSSAIIPSGNAFASLRASSRMREVSAIEEQWRGIEQLAFIQPLQNASDEELDKIGSVLESIRQKIFLQNRLTYNITADDSFQESLGRTAGKFFNNFQPGNSVAVGNKDQTKNENLMDPVSFETFVTSTDVAFNAIVLPAPRVSDSGQSAYTVLSHIITTNFLWEKIRVQGGAYGAHAEVNLLEGLFTMSSYRDPRIAGTYQDFIDSIRRVADGNINPSLIEKSIISLISRDLRPLTPREKSMLGFRRCLYGITDELRQKRREEFFSMTKDTISQAAGTLIAAYDSGETASVTIAGRKQVDANRKKLPQIINNIQTLVI
ncbi:MAG: insulinase family protein [Spirochaetales bacterium]|nr:insulinase family protein [Spirochaetales bacterium]